MIIITYDNQWDLKITVLFVNKMKEMLFKVYPVWKKTGNKAKTKGDS